MKIIPILSVLLLTASIGYSQQLQNGLIAHWDFNGNVKDVTNKGHDGTPYNITYTNGMTGQSNSAAVFNGSSSYVTAPFQNDLNLKKYSICAVVKLDKFYNGTCQGNYIVGRGAWPSQYGYSMVVYDNAYNNCYQSDTNKYVVSANAGDAHPQYDSDWQHNPNIHTGKWYTMVATYDTKEFKIYLDCELVNIATVYAGSMQDSSAPISIGHSILNSSSYPYWFSGAIDDIRIYDRVLNANEVSRYCEIVNGQDISYMPIQQYDEPSGNKQSTDLNSISARSFAMYPNPNNGTFTLSGNIGTTSDVKITILNTIGQTIYSKTTTAEEGMLEEKIDLNSNLPAGIYMVVINTDNGRAMLRFKKQ